MKRYISFAQSLLSSYSSWKVHELSRRRFSPETLHTILNRIIAQRPEYFVSSDIGCSFEGRLLRLLSLGQGRAKVVLWSQMHGDESTATMAIADILNYFASRRDADIVAEILTSLQLLFLPILNPDGAARFQRRTAQGLDINRDALALQTPEARVLKQLQHDHQPAFAFNLHDQELSTVGTSKELTCVALLAPAIDEMNSDDEVRTRAKHLAATMVEVLNLAIPGKIARYDESFEPRAFGDSMQRGGTSTLLIESGHAFDDPEKHSIRRLNAVGILSSLHAIATEEYRSADPSLYLTLPLNSKKAYDLIIRHVRLRHANDASSAADIAISYQIDTHTEDTPMLVEVGDLHTCVGLQEFDAGGRELPQELLQIGKPFEWKKFFAL